MTECGVILILIIWCGRHDLSHSTDLELWFGARQTNYLLPRGLHRRGPPAGVTFNAVFPSLDVALTWTGATQLCIPSSESLRWEEILWVVPGGITPLHAIVARQIKVYRSCITAWLSCVFSRSVYNTWGRHALSSLWCLLLIISLGHYWPVFKALFSLTNYAELALTTLSQAPRYGSRKTSCISVSTFPS
jgi:hypothetical protein